LLGVDENTNKVSEKLNQSPSVILRENTQNFGLSLVSIRGFSSNQTAVLYDGIKLPKDITSTYDLSILPTLNLENVYLFKGGWSSVFGANSEGGVVALKSETLKDEKLVDLFSEFGPYSTHRYVFKTGVSKDGVSLLLSGEDYKSDGFQQNSYANKQSFTGKLTIGKDDHKLTLNTFLVDLDRGLPSGTPVEIKSFNGEREKIAKSTTDWQSDRNFFISLKGEFRTGEFSNEISYSKNNLLRDAYQWSSLTEINTYSDNILARTSFEGYNFGIEYDKTKLRSNSYGNHEMKNIGYFANKSFNISEKLKTLVYLRYDDSKEYDNFLSPKLISDYKISDNLSVSYSIARSFRAPNFVDVYGYDGLFYRYDPNPNIKPEKSLSNEISISYSGNNISAIVSAYYYDIDDKITIITISTSPIWEDKSVNLAKGYNKGVEVSLGYSYKEFYINLGGSLMDIKGKNVGEGSYKKLAYSPDYKLSFGAGYKSNSFEFGLNTIRVGDQYSGIDKTGKLIPSYTVTDISASKSFGDLKLFAKINNLFNERYATTADSWNGYYPANPRNLFAGLSLKF
jgi:outer membrane receptor protein involved in Fe transport